VLIVVIRKSVSQSTKENINLYLCSVIYFSGMGFCVINLLFSMSDSFHKFHSMDIFSFVMTLNSIVIGIGLTELLSGFGRCLRSHKSVRWYWPHVVLTILIFLAFIQIWWEYWSLSIHTLWDFGDVIWMLITPTFLFLIAFVMYPTDPEGIDLEEYYYEKSRLIWTLAALTTVSSTLFRPIAFAYPLLVPDNATSLLLFICFIAMAITSKRSLHSIFVPIVCFLLLLDVALFSYLLADN